MSKIVIIGSANMDTTHYLSTDFPSDLTQECTNEVHSARVLGGKGANQARAAKLQTEKDEVYFIGCIGKDDSGLKIIEEFKRVGVNYYGVKVLDGKTTDGRIIQVDKNGNNKMMGYGECIKQLTPEMIDESILENADIVAIQMKMPPETVKFIIDYCHKNGKPLVIDPTPADKSAILAENAAELLGQAAYLTPNEEEAFALIGYMQGKTLPEINEEFNNTPKEKRLEMIEDLVRKFPNIVATVGGDGVIYNNGKVIRKATYPTECLDSTGAGDTFNGAFISSLSRDESLDRAVEFGLMASSMKVKHKGAQNGVPTYAEVMKSFQKLERSMQEGTEPDDDEGNR